MKTPQILYEDAQILAVNKPAGLASQGGASVSHSLDEILSANFGQKIYLIHRLDKDTSGILLAAKSSEAAAKYGKLLREAGIKKTYQALCAGSSEKPAGVIDLPVTVKGEEKESSTAYSLLESVRTVIDGQEMMFSRMELALGSGRTHQIRIHLAKTGMPIVADDKYGFFALNRVLKRETGIKMLCLASTALVFSSVTGEKISLSLEIPEHMRAFWATVSGICP